MKNSDRIQTVKQNADLTRLRLDMTKGCVEHAIKRLYEKTLSSFFNTHDQFEQDLSGKIIEACRIALEQFDFPYLRATFPELLKDTNKTVELCFVLPESPWIEVDGEKIKNKP